MKKSLLFIAFLLGWSPSVQAISIKHDLTVFIGPFNASLSSLEYTITPQDYAITSKVSTAGSFDSIYPFQADYFTTGRIKRNKLETISYHYQAQSRFTTRKKQLIYDDTGTLIERISSKNGKEKKVSVPTSDKNKNATDLQTVLAKIIKQYSELHFCDSRMKVFNGKRRFDVIFKDEGQEELPPSEYSPYFGDAVKCSMFIDNLNQDKDNLLGEISSQRPIYFWILEDKKHHPFVAKISISSTPLGNLTAYTSKITVKD